MSKAKKFILFQSIVSILLVMFLWDTIILQPLQTFAVAVHESFHGIAAIITGGSVVSMGLDLNSGVLKSTGGIFPIISAAGYVGTAIVGAALVVTVLYGFHKFIISLLTVFTFGLSAYYIDSYLSISLYISLAISLGILYLAWKTPYDKELSVFLGTFFAFASLEDIRTYFFAIPTQTDAGILARHLGSEVLTLPIAFGFAFVSILFWYLAIRKIIKEDFF